MTNKKSKNSKIISEIKRTFLDKSVKKYNSIKSNFSQKSQALFNSQKINFSNQLNQTKSEINKKLEKITGDKGIINNIENTIENRIKTNTNEMFLSSSVIWARYIMCTLIGGTAFGIGWLALAKTEEIIVTQGKLEPISGVVEIQMPIQGIAKEILVKEGQAVKTGKILLKLDPELNSNKLEALNSTLEINEEILNRLNVLVKEGAVSEFQYLQQKNKVVEIENQIKENNIISKYQSISSPIDGIVFDLKAVNPGFVGNKSEPILKIVPIDNLRAKIEIESRHIGFVSTNKKVDISIDSFPATDFGTISGKVSSISSDALKPDPQLGKGYRFPANVTLDKQTLQLKSGEELQLQAGMSLSANIKLRKVSYLQLLLGTFSDKASSLKEI